MILPLQERRQGSDACHDLLRPQRLWSRAEILSRPSPVPKAPGVYAWYFRNLDSLVPTLDCLAAGEFTLLCAAWGVASA